jgi:hypothetical protein
MQLKVLRGLPRFSTRSSVFAAISGVGAVALVAGCASELDDPDKYTAATGGGGAPPTAQGGTPGTPTGGTPPAAGGMPAGGGTAPPLPACVTTALTNALCTSCHAPGILLGGLDLMGADVGTRLRDASAKNMMATNAASCGTKLIDSNTPAQSVFLKRISGTSDCGPAMPSGNGVMGSDLECFRTWVMSF